MAYDKEFRATRDTLTTEEVTPDQLKQAVIGTLSNCILLQEKVRNLEKKLKENNWKSLEDNQISQ